MCLLSLLAVLCCMNDNICNFPLSFQLIVSSQSPVTMDDLYLEGRTSGDLPPDDEDGEDDGSGSGSGDYSKKTNVCLSICLLLFL